MRWAGNASTSGATGIGRADVSQLLALASPAARLVLGIFILSTVAFTVGTLDVVLSPWPSLLAMVIVCGAGVLLVQPAPDPFPARYTAALIVAIVASTLLVSMNVPLDGPLGRATWHHGANTWLLFFLAMRRRTAWAWIGMAIMVVLTAAWGANTGRGALAGAMMLDTHMGILVVGTLFAGSLRRTSARINALNDRSVEAAAETAAAAVGQEIRRQRVTELAAIASPLLERLASQPARADADREEFGRAEARLRDSVRGRGLTMPRIVEAVDAARRRGVMVTMLDDRGEPLEDGDVIQGLISVVVERLDAAQAGTVTVRLLPAGRDTTLTIVSAHGDDVERTSVGVDGREILG